MTLVSSWLTLPQNSKGNIGSEGVANESGQLTRCFSAVAELLVCHSHRQNSTQRCKSGSFTATAELHVIIRPCVCVLHLVCGLWTSAEM